MHTIREATEDQAQMESVEYYLRIQNWNVLQLNKTKFVHPFSRPLVVCRIAGMLEPIPES